MKTHLLLSLIAILGMVACDEIGKVTVDTTITKTIVTDIEEPSSGTSKNLKAAPAITAGYSFFESDIIDITENKDIQDYINSIDELDVYRVSCSLNGIPTGDTISELTVISNSAGLYTSLYNITKNNSTIELDISAAIMEAIGNKLLEQEKIEVTISGTSTYAPMTLSVKLNLESTIKADVLE